MGLLSTLAASGLSLFGGERANKSNAKEAQKNRSFQERLSSTSFQRGVVDLKAAGLNPILAAKFGGASTPSGAQAQIKDSVTPAVNTGMQLKLANAQVTKAEAEAVKATADAKNAESQNPNIPLQGNLLRTQADNIDADTSLKGQQHLKISAEVKKTIMETKSVEQRLRLLTVETKISQQQLKALLTKYPGLKAEQQIDETLYGKVIRYIMRLNPLAPNTSYQINRAYTGKK